jgi:hypothetical protein
MTLKGNNAGHGRKEKETMRPINSSYDTAAAASAANAETLLDTDTATVGDTLSYEQWESLDDLARDTMRQRLERRDLSLWDNSCDMVVVWLYAVDGSRLDPERDNVTAQNQPETAAE